MELSITGLPVRARARALSVLFVSISMLAACGEATCPAGSTQQGGMCIPIPECDDDEVLEEGECVELDASAPSDAAGGDGDGDGDAATDASTADSGDGDGDAGDGDAAAAHPCTDVDCGEHGECREIDGEAQCDCFDDFAGELCDVCEPGRGLKDGECVAACDADDAPDCSPNGECDVVDDEAVCVCERPFAGERCLDCAAGFALQSDQSCAPDCGTCGVHEFCDDGPEVPECACAAGYTKNGATCEWVGDGDSGGIVDGAFEDPDAWLTDAATIAGGEATFGHSGTGSSCELGVVQQTLVMPTLEEAEPMKLELDVTTTCGDSGTATCPPLLVQFGDHVARVPVPGGSANVQTVSVCLGAAAFGPSVELKIRPGLARGLSNPTSTPTAFSCTDDEWPHVRAIRVEAATAAECALADGFVNSTFGSTAGWTLNSASIGAGALTLNSNGTAEASVVMPSASENGRALTVHYGGSGGGNVRVSLGGLLFASVIWSTTTTGEERLCIPDWALGTGQLLTLQSASGSTSVIEGLSFDDDEACGDGAFDSGFERSSADELPSTGSWEYAAGTPYVRTSAARDGTKGVELSAAINSLRALVRFPDVESTSNVGFRIDHHKENNALNVSISDVAPLGTGSFTDVIMSWRRKTSCVDRAWIGQLAAVSVAATLSGAASVVELDNVGPIESSTCD